MSGPPAVRTATGRVVRAFADALARHRERLAGGPLVLGVSGGPDSLAMLLAAVSLPAERRPELIVAHFSHGIRPEDDEREAALVARAAEARGCVFHGGAADVPALVAERRESLEAVARDARYAFLARAAAAHGATAVAVAHTLDDQAETVLLRLTRGAGLRGAAAMGEWTVRRADGRPLRLLRPLLGVRRAETLQVCAEAGIESAEDPSNRALDLARNRVRHNVLPELGRLNPDVHAALARFAETAAETQEALVEVAKAAVRGGEQRAPGRVAWPRGLLRDLPGALSAWVFQSAWEYLHGGGAALSARHLRGMRRLTAGRDGGEVALPKGARFIVEQRRCSLEDAPTIARRRALPDTVVPLAVPGSSRLGPWIVEASLGRARGLPADAEDPFTAVLDADAVVYPLVLRRRRPGDRIVPLGIDREVRLQDLLVGAHIARTRRDSLVIMECSRGIAWVGGVRIAHWARVTDASKRTLTLRARRTDWGAPDEALR